MPVTCRTGTGFELYPRQRAEGSALRGLPRVLRSAATRKQRAIRGPRLAGPWSDALIDDLLGPLLRSELHRLPRLWPNDSRPGVVSRPPAEKIRLGPLRRVDFDAGEGPGGLGADDRI
jgi:hypothetical protein